MRIGVNARLLFTSEMEGIARYIYETTVRMAQAHPNDEFYSFYDRSNHSRPDFPSNVRHIMIPLPTRHPVLWYWWFEILLPIYLKWYKIDVFYSGDGYLSLRSKVPMVMVLHDLAYKHYEDQVSMSVLNYYKKYVPLFLKKATKIITVSHFVKRDILHHFDIKENKIIVAYNAVHPDQLLKNQNNIRINVEDLIDNKPYFVYVGSLHPRKNIVRMIDAFESFNTGHQNCYKLVLAGRMAWDTKEIEAKIKQSKNTIHMGFVTEADKYVLIQNACCLLYVSLFEGFGIPIIEGMIAGTPVITSDAASMPEIAGGAALLANPNDTLSIAAYIHEIVSNESLQQQLIKNGKQRAGAFDWKISAEKIYQALLDSLKN